MSDYDLICLGCGPAGEKAALHAAGLGRRVAVVERAPAPGGTMVNTGTLPSKSLRETALLCSAFRRRPLPGWHGALDHDLSITRLMAQRYRVQYQEHDRIESALDGAGVRVLRGHGRLEDPNTVSVEALDGSRTTLRGEHLLIATGSSPARPDDVPFDGSRVVDADEVLELTRVPDSIVVAGGGVIGCEYACMFAEIGTAVTIVDPRDALLPFLDAECRNHLVRAMGDEGIEIRPNTSIAGVETDGGGVTARTDGGETLRADVLLWAAGRCSNTADLGLENVGIAPGPRGLLTVNDRYQTSVANVYAAGDVIGFPALASTAQEQGRIAACHMFDAAYRAKLAGTLPFGLYTIPAVGTVGVTEQQAAAEGRAVVVGRALYRNNPRGRMLGDEEGMLKCVFDRGDRRLLGATVVGEAATELIHLAQFVMIADGGLDDFIEACFNYPSLSGLYKSAALDAQRALAEPEAAAAA